MPNCTNAPSAIFWLLSAIAACRCSHSIHRPTKRRRRLLKKLRRNARSKTPRSYQRKAARNLVPGRGAHWPARHADPCLGQTRDAPPCAARSALRMGLHFWRRLPAAPHHRSPRRADRQHRSHVHASQRNRGQRRTGRARSPCSRRRWISSRHRPRRTRQHHTCSPAALRTRAQPDRKRLAISARQQALQHDLRKLRRYPRKSLPSMDVLRQRQGAGRFNHHTPMGKGQSLAPLVLAAISYRLGEAEKSKEPVIDIDPRVAFKNILNDKRWLRKHTETNPEKLQHLVSNYLCVRLDREIHNLLAQGKLVAWGEKNLEIGTGPVDWIPKEEWKNIEIIFDEPDAVSYTHLRAHETV